MDLINRQITLAARPSGNPTELDFHLEESPVPDLKDGEVLVRTIYLSVDPYMRSRMNARKSYAPPVEVGEVMTGGVVGKVISSRNPRFPEGTIVSGLFGWQEYTVTDGQGVRPVDPSLAPISTALGILGMPGLTAYFGLLDIGKPKEGETVVVSGAAGAVGSMVGQIAKLKGCRVVGIAGSDDKVKHLVEELGFDAAFNYKTVTNYVHKLRELCPSGIDIYFDNVGGPITDAVFALINLNARIVICGQISQYNLERTEMGPRLLGRLIEQRARIEGFLVFDYTARYKEGIVQLAQWMKAGKIQCRETIVEGLENAPKAFLGLFTGKNLGKQLVQVSEDEKGAQPVSDLVTTSRDGDIGVITVNNPPVNALSPGVPEGIEAALKSFRDDPAITAVALIGGGRTFIAGADIKEFGKMTSGKGAGSKSMGSMFPSLEEFPKPVIAAIHGTAFGGGLETAMSCHQRFAVASAQVGQPEVKLGLIPGAGGTQRLPRLVGLAKAAEMCAGGDPISAAEAQKLGIIDKIIEGDLLQGAVAFAREIAARGGPPRKTCDLPLPKEDPQALAAVKGAVAKRARGLVAPLMAVEAVEAAALPFDEGMKKEAELFTKCLFSDQSKGLIHAFFGERAVSKVPGISKDTPLIPIKLAAVVGAGTMGGGIAMNYANAGIPVMLKEVSQEQLDRGLGIIRKNYAATVKKGRLTEQQMEQRMALIQPVLTFDRFKEADIVVEAVFEGLELKKKVFAELDVVTRPDAILASNTSTLDIDAIAASTSRPQQVIGHHFFSPANVMRLLEVVRGQASSPQVIATSMALSKTLRKVGVLVGNCRGFVGNRMFFPYQRESQFLLEEGAAVEQVDAALLKFGMALGPLGVADLAGLDVGWRIRKEYAHLDLPNIRKTIVEDLLCEQGRYGQKTGAGWYVYPEGSRTPVPDPMVQKLIEDVAQKAGIKRRTISNEEIIDRTIYALVNEGAKILEEGIALRAVDIDIIYLSGYGFPAFRGGPMFYADTVGIQKVYDRIRDFEKEHGATWTPAPLLERLAESGKTFADLDKEKERAVAS